MAVTPARGYIIQVTGTNSGTWGNVFNNQVLALIDENFGGVLAVDLTGQSGNVAVSADNDEYANLVCSGAMTGDVVLQLPGGRSGHHFISNDTTGGTLTIATTAGGSVGAVCASNAMTFVFNDGTDVTNPNASGSLPSNGSTSTTSAVSFTLSTGTTVAQKVTMTATSKSVILPDATLFGALGGPVFSIANNGTFPFGIRRNDNSLLCVLNPRQSVDLYLDAQATAAGVWHFVGDTATALQLLDYSFASTYIAIGETTYQSTPIQVGTSSSFVVFVASASNLYAVAVDCSTFPATVGTPQSVDSVITLPTGQFQIDNTHIWISWVNSTNRKAAVLTVSGSTLTVGSVATTASVILNGSSINPNQTYASMGAGLWVFSGINASNNVVGLAVSISGTSISIGSESGAISNAAGAIVVNSTYMITGTTALVIYSDNTGGGVSIRACVLSISGTTITVNTSAGKNSVATGLQIRSCQLSTTSYVIGWIATATTFASYANFTVSGTTITANATFVPTAQAITNLTSSNAGGEGGTGTAGLITIDGTHALSQAMNGTVIQYVPLTNTGGTLSAGTIQYAVLGSPGILGEQAGPLTGLTFMGFFKETDGASQISSFALSSAGLSVTGAAYSPSTNLSACTFASSSGGIVAVNPSAGIGRQTLLYSYGGNGPIYLGTVAMPNGNPTPSTLGLAGVGSNIFAVTYSTSLGPSTTVAQNVKLQVIEVPT